jgi:hypothetical protein
MESGFNKTPHQIGKVAERSEFSQNDFLHELPSTGGMKLRRRKGVVCVQEHVRRQCNAERCTLNR